MSLIDDIKNDINAAKKMRLPRWAILPGIVFSFFAAMLFDHFGKLDLTLPMLNCIGVLGFLIALKWRLRRRAWFWMIMVIISALHVPLILSIPWTSKWVPALAIATIDSADFCMLVWILDLVGKFMGEPTVADSEPPRSKRSRQHKEA